MNTLSNTQTKQAQKEAYIKQMMGGALASAVQKDIDLSPLTSTTQPISPHAPGVTEVAPAPPETSTIAEQLMKMDINEWPKSIRRFAEIVGKEAAIRVMLEYGGQTRIYVPQSPQCTKFSQRVGQEAAKMLAKYFGGSFLTNIPHSKTIAVHLYNHNRNIIIHARRAAGEKIEVLAKEYGLTERWVRNLLAKLNLLKAN